MNSHGWNSHPSIRHPPRVLTAESYIRNLPYSICKTIADELDPPGTATNWKDFVMKIPKSPDNPESKYTVQHISRFGAVAANGHSPTMAVIESWSTSNSTAQDLMDVLMSLGLHRLVSLIQSRITSTQPPSYDESVTNQSVSGTSHQPVQNSAETPPVPARPKPTYQRQPTEHESLPSTSAYVNPAKDASIATSAISLEGFSLDGSVSSYPYSSLLDITSDFNDSLKLGEGAFGSVFKGHLSNATDVTGKNVKESRKIAIKRLKLDTPDFASSIAEQFKKEVDVISVLQHENILPLMGYSCDGPELCLVYDYMFNGSLSSSLDLCRKSEMELNVGQRLEIARGSSSGIAYLHDKQLIHRDIKSSNILLDSQMKPRISDFGLIRSTKSEVTTKQSTRTANPLGTPVYMAPEAYHGAVSFAMDAYSFGVVLLELLTGLAVVDEARDPSPLTLYIEEKHDDQPVESFYDRKAGVWAPGIAEALFDLSNRCLEYRRVKRPAMKEVFSELVTLCTKEASTR